MARTTIRRPGATNAGGFFAMFYEWTVLNSGRPSRVSDSKRHISYFTGSELPRSRRHQQLRQIQSTRPSITTRIPLASTSLGCNTCYSARSFHNKTSLSSSASSTPNAPTKALEEPPLSTHLRSLMRSIPHSVVVATSTLPAPDRGTPPTHKGMTVSSFTTLTLTPTPIITLNIRKPSSTLSAIAASKHFFIHILSATVSGARIADVFAKNAKGVFKSGEFMVVKGMRRENDGGELEPPLLAATGITRVLRCKLLKDNGLVEVGDHTLILAEVRGVIESGRDGEGLCYSDGKYRGVGEVIEVGEKK